MSYDGQKILPGQERIDVVQIDLERCSLINGTAPCTATSPCVNSWATCRDKPNYAVEDWTVTFCTPASICPDGYIPFLSSVSVDAGEPDPENGLGKRTSVKLNFIDAPHDDIGIDPYIATRGWDAMQRGTFWPRFKARWPFYNGRAVRWYRGFAHEPFSLANCKLRSYIASDLSGWGRGTVTLTAKDPLTLADNDQAEYPPRSTGILAEALSDTASYTHFDITTDRATEYDIQSWEPGYSAVRIGDEILKYTGVTTITGGVRLTGIVHGGFDQYQTTRQDHDIGDAVQKCAYFKNMRPIDVFQVLLEDGAGIDAAFIPYADWLTEASTWISSFRITRLVCDPEGVLDHLKELIPQTSTWALWWDDEASEIKYRCVRPPDTTEVIASLTDDANIAAGSVKCLDDTSRLLNEVYVTMGQRDPTKKIDDAGNYAAGFLTVNSDSQGTNETRMRKAKTIWGRWQPTGNRAELTAIVDRMLLARSFVPIRLEFSVHRKDDSINTGDFAYVQTLAHPDEFGATQSALYRILNSRSGDTLLKVTAIEETPGTVGNFARWAPDDIPKGLEWADATQEQRDLYWFWADDDGYLGGDPGKRWL